MKTLTDLFSNLNSKPSYNRYYITHAHFHSKKTKYLTLREAVIVYHLLHKRRAKEIAWLEDSSVHTINTHLANIKQKFSCLHALELGFELGKRYYDALISKNNKNLH